MKKKPVLILLFFVLILCSCSRKSDDNFLTVYAYDSFCGQWGAGENIAKAFEAQTGIRINLVSCQGAAQMYQRILSEGEQCKADVVIGLSNQIQIQKDLFYPFTPSCQDSLISYNKDSNMVPFDWGVFAFVTDYSSVSTPIPTCLEDLTLDCYKNRIILIDPRTSSVGAGLLMWTIQVLGEEKAFEWWEKMSDNALTIADSWSSAYGLFTEHEADYVLTYSTSPVYHRLYEDNTSIRTLEFSDPYLRETEYLAILATSQKKEESQMFCDFVLTQGQSEIALCNTMFPANKDTVLDSSFEAAYLPQLFVIYDEDSEREKLSQYLDKWTLAVSK